MDVQDEREGLIRTLLVELGGQILVFFPEESEVILLGVGRAFFFRYSSFRLALLLIVDGGWLLLLLHLLLSLLFVRGELPCVKGEAEGAHVQREAE